MQATKITAMAVAFATMSSAGFAQNYPTRAITLLVPFAADVIEAVDVAGRRISVRSDFL